MKKGIRGAAHTSERAVAQAKYLIELQPWCTEASRLGVQRLLFSPASGNRTRTISSQTIFVLDNRNSSRVGKKAIVFAPFFLRDDTMDFMR